ncbi:putative ankyrin repeat protein RF_0381 [Leptopilina boulardi]|uniref:putative ankyrin repeat protein RF_0381 n=1 Tax=Leptopilina boulardi TaxID=63433 RepID=UPI0021F5DE7D|nr:putative ankyrin repeat protein RF_0381 [Leptopilina boulardi]XP_051154849.1 putative ankyrin repeat protein RF_0381 [Leptopilina boulardi]XP_051154850.1 putative ankyrin repeat protein RF_0381 [Leptopilina boulardi]
MSSTRKTRSSGKRPPEKESSQIESLEEPPKKIRKLTISFLVKAIKKGNIKKVKEFLSYQNDEFKQDGKKNTPLHYAAQGENIEILKLMIDHNYGKINNRNRCKKTPIHLALENNCLEIIKCLIEHGSKKYLSSLEINNYMRFYFINNRLDILKCLITNEIIHDSLIYYSVVENRFNILKYLLEKCLDKINKIPTKFFFLHKAAEKGKLGMVELFFNAKFDIIGGKNLYERTPLYYAVREGHLKVVKFLMKNGAKNVLTYKQFFDVIGKCIEIGRMDILEFLNIKEYISIPMLYIAASNDRWEILEYLIECGVQINTDFDLDTPLHGAAEYGHIDIVKYLIESGYSNNNVKNSNNKTALDLALLNNQLDVVKYFIENESMKIIKKIHLFEIVRCGYLKLLKYLIDNGCGEINTKTDDNISLLHYSAYYGQLDILLYLLANDAEVNIFTEEEKETPLSCAIREGHTEIVKQLLKNGAEMIKVDINAENVKDEILTLLLKAGHSMVNYFGEQKPFLIAAEMNYWQLVEAFIEIGVDVNSLNEKYQTALDFAVVELNLKMVRILLAAGANPKGNVQNQYTPLDCVIQKSLTKLENIQIEILKELLDYIPKDDLEEIVVSCINLAIKQKTSINIIKLFLDYDYNNKYKLTIQSLESENTIFMAIIDHIQKFETFVEFQELLIKTSREKIIYINGNIKQALIARIILLKSLPRNLNIGEEKTFDNFVNAIQIKQWNNKCQNEITLMKNTKILPDELELTYYDFLAKPLCKLEFCVSNEKLMENLENIKSFQMYKEFFKRRVKKIRERIEYIDSCRKSFYYAIRYSIQIHLPCEIVENICDYLNVLQIKRLSEAFPVYDKNSC